MTDWDVVSLVILFGCLFLWGSAFASFRLGWSKIVQLALVWCAIFGGLFLIVDFLGLGLER